MIAFIVVSKLSILGVNLLNRIATVNIFVIEYQVKLIDKEIEAINKMLEG
jgi:hypothetical protein